MILCHLRSWTFVIKFRRNLKIRSCSRKLATCSSQRNSRACNIPSLWKSWWLMTCPAFSSSTASGQVTSLGLHSSERTLPGEHMPEQQLAEWSSPVEEWVDYQEGSAAAPDSWGVMCLGGTGLAKRAFFHFWPVLIVLHRMCRVG